MAAAGSRRRRYETEPTLNAPGDEIGWDGGGGPGADGVAGTWTAKLATRVRADSRALTADPTGNAGWHGGGPVLTRTEEARHECR
jgi:hypothetical protein